MGSRHAAPLCKVLVDALELHHVTKPQAVLKSHYNHFSLAERLDNLPTWHQLHSGFESDDQLRYLADFKRCVSREQQCVLATPTS